MVSVLLALASVFASKGYQDIDAAGTKALMENADALVVFPLSPIKFYNKHIEGSVKIVMEKLEYDLPQDKDRKIF